MIKTARAFLVTVLIAVAIGGSSTAARADDGDGAANRAKLGQAMRAIAAMRESYAYVLKKEEEAKGEHDPVRLNALHQIVLRIAELVNASDHELDDVRVAIVSNEAPEAVDAKIGTIMLAKTKVEQARREADRTVGVKMVASGGECDSSSREFSESSPDSAPKPRKKTTTDFSDVEVSASASSPAMKEAPAPSPSAAADRAAAKVVHGSLYESLDADMKESPTPAPSGIVAAPAMRAGRHDDNKEYNRFLSFLGENERLVTYPVDIGERLVVRALDKNGKSLPNCAVAVSGLDGRDLADSVTFADGRTQFFPADRSDPQAKDYAVTARCGAETRKSQLSRSGRRGVDLQFGTARALVPHVPVDIGIVIDTTGSMGSQIGRLKSTLRAIHYQLTQLPSQPDIRFGLVAYRDHGDEYLTKVVDFTGDVAGFQEKIDALQAGGGGDEPEDVQEGLKVGLHSLSWRKNAIRVAFLIGDAVPHTDYGETYTYREAMREGLARGIKIVAVGVGGLKLNAEVVWRQLAQFTMAEYIFVTENGGGDTGGDAAEASHHVGANYQTENLDQAIVRVVRREVSYLTDNPRDFDDTIVAQSNQPVGRDVVLGPAVDEALRQLADYSALHLKPGTPVAIVPVVSNEAAYKDVAGYLSERFAISASRNPAFKVVERDLQALAQEQRLQLSGLFDDKDGEVPFGKLIGAQELIVAKLAVGADEASLFAKMIRVETGEVLSVAHVEIGKTLVAAKTP